MAVTSGDVARQAGVSRATVSYIVNGKGARFSEETRKAVLDAAAELGYQPQAAGRALVTGRSNIVLVAIPHTPNAVFLSMMKELADRLTERALTLLLLPPIDAIEAFASTIRSVRPQAVMSLGTLPEGYADELRGTGTRWLDYAGSMSRPNGFNWQLGALQARHLIERGYSALAYARSREAGNDVVQWAREQGFGEVCATHGLPAPVVIEMGLPQQASRDAVSSLAPGTGVGCFNDETALDVLHGAALAGLRVPDDLGVIGVDNTPAVHTTAPPLSSVAYDVDLERTILVEVLADDLDHESFVGSVLADGNLRVEARESTQRVQVPPGGPAGPTR